MSEGTQRGLAETFHLKVTFVRCWPCPAESQNSRDHLYEPNSPFPEGPSARCPSCYLRSTSLSGQVPRPKSKQGSRQGLGTTWPLAQRCLSTQPSVLSLPHKQSSKGEGIALPPLPPDAVPTKEKLLPSILCPGGPSRTGVVRTPSPHIANGTAGHYDMTTNDSGANAAPRIYNT